MAAFTSCGPNRRVGGKLAGVRFCIASPYEAIRMIRARLSQEWVNCRLGPPSAQVPGLAPTPNIADPPQLQNRELDIDLRAQPAN